MTTETKMETFQRLFPGRAAKVLDTLRVAGHCMKSHMEADTALTDPFVRDVREALDLFPPLGTDILGVSIPGLEEIADTVVADPARQGGTAFRYEDDENPTCEECQSPIGRDGCQCSEETYEDQLARFQTLDRAKVAYGLSKLQKFLDGYPHPLPANSDLKKARELIREGIGRTSTD